MNTKDIEKREELCRLLNMNFDEADELFSDETMQSMQMAQVNGGGTMGSSSNSGSKMALWNYWYNSSRNCNI